MSDVIAPIFCEIDPCDLAFVIDESVQLVWAKYRQRFVWSKEAGGQIFAQLRDGCWHVGVVTVPVKHDRRGRYFFHASREAEQKAIESMFLQGWHYVGDWHTHPEKIPTPSMCDIASISEVVQKSKHHLPGFLLVIVGSAKIPETIWISFHPKRGDWVEVKKRFS